MYDKRILDKIIEFSEKVFNFWSNSYGWAPNNASELLSVAKFDWLLSLTKTLEIWVNKSICMSDGDLLLARTNLGSLVEGWMKLFYCVYYNDYANDENKKFYKGKERKPNELSFDVLRKFSLGKLWDEGDKWGTWVEKVQHMRNAIHSFNDRNIGTAIEFLEDVKLYYEFINEVNTMLPYPDEVYI